MQTIEEKEHSRIGASGAYRWMACPASVALCRGRNQPPSEYAAEGTVAHHIAEQDILGKKTLEDQIGATFTQDGFEIAVTQEMTDNLRPYLDFVDGVRLLEPFGDESVELNFGLPTYHPDLFGTADYTMRGVDTLYVADLKYGAGKPVEVEENPQLMIYGLGAVEKYAVPDYTKVILAIIQPRCLHKDGPVRTWETTAGALREWGREVLKPAAKLTDSKKAPFLAGDHCGWCAGKPACPAQLKKAKEISCVDFDAVAKVDEKALPPVAGLAPEQIANILIWKGLIEKWLAAVYVEAQRQLLENPEAVPGFKVVEGRANRKWCEDFNDRCGDLFIELKQDLYDVKPKSPAQMEKALKEKGLSQSEIREMVDPLVQLSRGLQVAPEYDKRPAYSSVENMFENQDEELF